MGSCNPYLFRAGGCLELIPTCSGARGCLDVYYIFSKSSETVEWLAVIPTCSEQEDV
jgi:hypothetical protein